MRKDNRVRAAQQIGKQLVVTENALENALTSIARLIQTSIDARAETQVPIHCGHLALTGMGKVMELIVRAREELIEVHSELLETKILVGLGAGPIKELRPHSLSDTGDNFSPISARQFN